MDEVNCSAGAVDASGISDWACVVTTDASVGKIFFACHDDRAPGVVPPSLIVVESYDLATNQGLGMLSLGIGDAPSKIVRWGSDGLAVATATSVLINHGGFVR